MLSKEKYTNICHKLELLVLHKLAYLAFGLLFLDHPTRVSAIHLIEDQFCLNPSTSYQIFKNS